MYFFLFVVVCLALALWALQRSKSDGKRVGRRAGAASSGKKAARRSSALDDQRLRTPSMAPIAYKEEVWAARRKFALGEKTDEDPVPYGTAFTIDQDADYDGYSRRDRHRLSPAPPKRTVAEKPRKTAGGANPHNS